MTAPLIANLPAALANGGALHALTAHHRFIVYKLTPSKNRPGKIDKLPVDHRTGRVMLKDADWQNDPAAWTDADTAIAVAARLGPSHGVGFLFRAEDPFFFFLDIDNCLQPNGTWSPVAVDLYQRFSGAAVEVSQSGRGLHIIGRALAVPHHGCKNIARGLELYHEGRFVALTGTSAAGDASADLTGALVDVIAKYFPPSATAAALPTVGDGPRPEWNGPTDDDELIAKALASGGNLAGRAFGDKAKAMRSGDKASFAALWTAEADVLGRVHPDTGGDQGRAYDASSADAALALRLAFWTGCDMPRMERLMRRSALARDKWDKHSSYMQRTILNATGLCKEVYTGGKALGLPDVEDDVPADGHPDLSHDHLARKLSTVAGFTQDARYIPAWSRWLFWSGTRWEVDERLRHMTIVRDFLLREAKGLVAWAEHKAVTLDEKDAEKYLSFARSNAKALRQAGNVTSVETLARSNADLVATVDLFDADLMLLGTPGGTVDLRTGELLPAMREHWITKQTATTPAPPGTPAPLWTAFMDRIFGGDHELIAFLQRAAGYALTGHTSEHKLLFCYGTGGNGKSVFLNTLFGIVGEYARRAPAQTFLDSSSDRHPTDLAGLHGARLVIGSELPAGKAWNESVVKDLTGGDVITARKMRQDFFEYMPQFTLFIAGNHQPSFRGIDEAIRRRVALVPFTQTIPAAERDQALPEKLKAEWPAILRWMIDGALAWQAQGLNVPAAVQTASEEYLDFEDTLGDFIEEHLIRAPGTNTHTGDIYLRFTAWQRISGINQTWTKKAMTQALRERGYTSAKLTAGARGFRDVALKKPPPTTADAERNLAEKAFGAPV
jgi:P4 family phage/plasmid primase-like protien